MGNVEAQDFSIYKDKNVYYNQEGSKYSIGESENSKVRYNSNEIFPEYYDYDQLYDLQADSNEQYNLAYSKRYEDVVKIIASNYHIILENLNN